MLNKLIITGCVALLSISAHTRPNPSYVGVCYEFDEDKLVDYDTCVVSTGNGSGVLYTTLKYNNNKYLLDNAVDQGATWSINGLKANEYVRDPFYLERADKEDLIQYDDPIIYCFESKDMNICHN